MNSLKFIAYGSIALFVLACGGEKDPSRFFDIKLDGRKKEFKVNQTVGVAINNKAGKTIDRVTYSIDGKELPLINNEIALNVSRLGNKVIKASINYEDGTVDISRKIKVLADKAPDLYTYEILNEYPHDMNAYTQGLEFYNDTLYEGTGKNGNSSLRKIDYKTGEILEKIDLEKNFFGEGITILNGKIYQLTWRSKIGFVYDLESFKKTGSFQYGKSQEGWGLCNNGQVLFKSDGTEKIWLLDPVTLVEKEYIQTVTNTSIFNRANELEYVDGKLYANVWQKESVMIIDSESGAIEGVVNFGGLKSKTKKPNDTDAVLNGVAYHPKRETFFVTGKYWDKLFEVQIRKKTP
ncbi:MAG: glutaminyl-peptide cyclotransferase [Eudoraea sp.]|nr:glutaminyl-peptide cyclotransferase [Eudoraea sp.]